MATSGREAEAVELDRMPARLRGLLLIDSVTWLTPRMERF